MDGTHRASRCHLFGYALHLEYGWETNDVRVRKAGGFDFLCVEGGRDGPNSLGTVCDIRVLPSGYDVDRYEILWQEWEEIDREFSLGIVSGTGMTEIASDDSGGVEVVIGGGLLGYRVTMVVIQPVRVVGGRPSFEEALLVLVEGLRGRV